MFAIVDISTNKVHVKSRSPKIIQKLFELYSEQTMIGVYKVVKLSYGSIYF